VVSVVKCRDLPAKDPNLGSCDPYVKLQLLPDKQHKVKTRVLRKTRNPVYDEDFTFYGITFNQLQVYISSVVLKACSQIWGGRSASNKKVLAVFISETVLVNRYFSTGRTTHSMGTIFCCSVFPISCHSINQCHVTTGPKPLISPWDSNSGLSHLGSFIIWNSPLSIFKIKLKTSSYILA
jgi:hypothetical protein